MSLSLSINSSPEDFILINSFTLFFLPQRVTPPREKSNSSSESKKENSTLLRKSISSSEEETFPLAYDI